MEMRKIKYEMAGINCLTQCEKFKYIKVGSWGCRDCIYNHGTTPEKYVICNAFKR